MDVATKVCTRCHIEKPLTEYCKGSRFKLGVQPACKACMNVSYNASRTKKQQHYQQVQKSRQLACIDQYNTWREQQRCLVCGEDDPSVLDLHHLDPTTKEDSVANLVRSVS